MLKTFLFDKVQIREHCSLTMKEKRKKPIENKTKQKPTLLRIRTRVNRMNDYYNHHYTIHADTLKKSN